jgi:hypothetical protein
MRTARPWYRAATQSWYVYFRGKQVFLGKDKKEADLAFHRLMASEGATAPGKDMKVAILFDLFLDHSQRHHAPETYEWFKFFLQDFVNRYGRSNVSALRPFHVTQWLDAHDWSPSSRHGAVSCVKRAVNFDVAQGYIGDSPIKALKREPIASRKRVLTPEEQRAIHDATPDRQFRDLLTAPARRGAALGRWPRSPPRWWTWRPAPGCSGSTRRRRRPAHGWYT